MAKYDVTRSCGHEEVVNLIGPGKNREWRLEHVEPYRLCYECYQAEKARKQAEENTKAAELAKEWELPELQGTEKQIAWAETIRTKLIEAIEATVIKHKPNTEKLEQLQEAVESIKNKSDASWWIDRRDIKLEWDILQLIVAEAELLEKTHTDSPAGQNAEAIAEATVRPEKPVTETIAEIRLTENVLEIRFPEKRDDFREIAKFKLKMDWSGTSWKRKLGFKAGDPPDRATEAGCRLLAAGFPVRAYDNVIREKIVSGNYKPESTRWISRLASGEFEGWFAISWNRDDGDFYGPAKRIHGSRWIKPNVVVSPENFEEVLDFAKVYGFELSDGAHEVVALARQVKENSLTARGTVKHEVKVMPDTIPPILEVPEHVDIADEFKD